MNFIRSLVFAICFYSTTTVMAFLLLPTLLMPMEPARACYRVWSRITWVMISGILGIRYKVEFAEGASLPKGATLIACKHQSAWETILSERFIHNPAFVMKKELTKIPLFGAYLVRSGQISVDRSAGPKALRGMIALARQRAEEGRSLVIYPQGTRVAPGEHKPYQSGIAALYRGLGIPVVPIALNSGLFWPRNSFMKRPGTITIRVLPPIEPGLDKPEFMRVLEERIETASNALESDAK